MPLDPREAEREILAAANSKRPPAPRQPNRIGARSSSNRSRSGRRRADGSTVQNPFNRPRLVNPGMKGVKPRPPLQTLGSTAPTPAFDPAAFIWGDSGYGGAAPGSFGQQMLDLLGGVTSQYGMSPNEFLSTRYNVDPLFTDVSRLFVEDLLGSTFGPDLAGLRDDPSVFVPFLQNVELRLRDAVNAARRAQTPTGGGGGFGGFYDPYSMLGGNQQTPQMPLFDPSMLAQQLYFGL